MIMKKILTLIVAVALAVPFIKAQECADSMAVKVMVEINMPDGTVVTKQVRTNIPDPGADTSIGRLLDLASQKLLPDSYSGERKVVREVVIVEKEVTPSGETTTVQPSVPEKHRATAAVVEPEPVVEQPPVSDPVTSELEIDPVTGQTIVPLMPASEVIKSNRPLPSTHKTPINHHRNWKPDAVDAVRNARFAWGAELASSIDLSAHDMTSVDMNLSCGVTYRWLIFAGVGVGGQMALNNSCRTYPLFLNFRTDFSRKVLPIFLDVRGGLALNYLPDNLSQRSPYASISLGFNLATGRTFRSYILCGYSYNGRGDINTEIGLRRFPALSMASVRLGVQF